MGLPLGELAHAAQVARRLAENGWRRCEGRAGADAALAGDDDAGHLPAIRSRVAASGGGSAECADYFGAVKIKAIEFCAQLCANGKG